MLVKIHFEQTNNTRKTLIRCQVIQDWIGQTYACRGGKLLISDFCLSFQNNCREDNSTLMTANLDFKLIVLISYWCVCFEARAFKTQNWHNTWRYWLTSNRCPVGSDFNFCLETIWTHINLDLPGVWLLVESVNGSSYQSENSATLHTFRTGSGTGVISHSRWSVIRSLISM